MNEVKEIVKEAMGTQERAPTTKCDVNEVKEIVKQALGTQERAPTTKCDVNEVKEIVKQALGTQERAPTTHKHRPVQCRIGQSGMIQLRKCRIEKTEKQTS